jgi:hypothetical protein
MNDLAARRTGLIVAEKTPGERGENKRIIQTQKIKVPTSTPTAASPSQSLEPVCDQHD